MHAIHDTLSAIFLLGDPRLYQVCTLIQPKEVPDLLTLGRRTS